MPQELAELMNVLSHPDRVRLVCELSQTEKDVNTLVHAMALPQARVSQQLAILRSQRLVAVRRSGRHIFYRLRQPRIADWILQGIEFAVPPTEGAVAPAHP